MVDHIAGGPRPQGIPGSAQIREYLMGLEDKPLMDEFVALYIGMSSNKKLEQQFRENLNVSTNLIRTSC